MVWGFVTLLTTSWIIFGRFIRYFSKSCDLAFKHCLHINGSVFFFQCRRLHYTHSVDTDGLKCGFNSEITEHVVFVSVIWRTVLGVFNTTVCICVLPRQRFVTKATLRSDSGSLDRHSKNKHSLYDWPFESQLPVNSRWRISSSVFRCRIKGRFSKNSPVLK